MQNTRVTPKMPVRSGSLVFRRRSALLGKSAPPLTGLRLAAHGNQDVAACRPVDLDRHRAKVDVEERAIGTERGQPQVILAELLNVVVHFGFPIVDLGGDRAGVLNDALER